MATDFRLLCRKFRSDASHIEAAIYAGAAKAMRSNTQGSSDIFHPESAWCLQVCMYMAELLDECRVVPVSLHGHSLIACGLHCSMR